ncbi:hypothetical protein GRX03_01700 [Halovenus sp. WSH3]|uniref:Uncharacterized protein n=1 Tax=Halovenus carboxidivorans TaxID=2692199 RepID=A0A6B0SXR6_9EURY|nr:hypothetical protein [Halovenus carboxidivorans]MXR50324.1 hypothetical protein [Halovenus carboxidivorans]
MICRIGSVVRSGQAVTVEQQIDAERIRAAITRSGPGGGHPSDCGEEPAVRIDCADPTPVHEYVGHIRPEMGLRARTALAVAGRTRGLDTPHDEEIERLEAELSSITVEESDLEDHREALADERRKLQRAREAVAETRGRLAASREHGLETDDLEAELRRRIQELAELETTATAATQRHEQHQAAARRRRDQRERRFALEDELENRRRDARRALVDQLEGEFAAAVRELSERQLDDPFECRPALAGLAVARLAEYDAPIVLETSQFESAAAARAWLGGPVLKL